MKRASIREIVEHPKPNEYYVLVTRHYPPYLRFKGLKLTDTAISEWDKDLAPSAELIKDYKENKITWKEYTERFKKEIPLALAKRKFQIHQENAKGKEVVLVCIEEDWQRPECHTWILLDMYREKKLCLYVLKRIGNALSVTLGFCLICIGRVYNGF